MTSPLIAASELQTALDTADRPVVLDVRWKLGGPPDELLALSVAGLDATLYPRG